MHFHQLRAAGERAPLDALARAIDALRRPWAPAENDALRAAWHGVRRGGGRGPLLALLEQQLRALPGRDREHVAAALGLPGPAPAEALADALARLLGPAAPPRPAPALDLLPLLGASPPPPSWPPPCSAPRPAPGATTADAGASWPGRRCSGPPAGRARGRRRPG